MKFNIDKKLLITLDLSSLSLEELNEIKNIIDSEMKNRIIPIPSHLVTEDNYTHVIVSPDTCRTYTYLNPYCTSITNFTNKNDNAQ